MHHQWQCQQQMLQQQQLQRQVSKLAGMRQQLQHRVTLLLLRRPVLGLLTVLMQQRMTASLSWRVLPTIMQRLSQWRQLVSCCSARGS
jgi:hypothetical protein